MGVGISVFADRISAVVDAADGIGIGMVQARLCVLIGGLRLVRSGIGGIAHQGILSPVRAAEDLVVVLSHRLPGDIDIGGILLNGGADGSDAGGVGCAAVRIIVLCGLLGGCLSLRQILLCFL